MIPQSKIILTRTHVHLNGTKNLKKNKKNEYLIRPCVYPPPTPIPHEFHPVSANSVKIQPSIIGEPMCKRLE